MNTKRMYYALSGSIVSVSLVLLFIAYSYKQDKIAHELEIQLNLNMVYYQETYSNYHQLARNINIFIFNNQQNMDIFKQAHLATKQKQNELRQQLYERLKPGYPRLQDIGFQQLHFHLPNNTSFLRMHKPSRFGDDLSDIRYSVKAANATLQPISGFEEGRIVDGFRFVFPLFDENGTHVGSAEASISSLAFIQHIEQTYHSDLHFIIKKELVEKKLWKEEIHAHYTNSFISPEYYSEIYSLNPHYNEHNKTLQIKNLAPLIHKNLQSEKKFSLYNGLHTIVSFLPIHNIEENRTIAYFVVYDENHEIPEANSIFHVTVTLTLLFSTLLLLLLRSEYLGRTHIEAMNQELEARIKHEVEKSQKRDRQMMEQSRLAQMGEMISMIAHQWRQPLGAIASTVINMKMKIDLNTYDLNNPKERETCQKEFDEALKDINIFVENLTTTIDDFRNFYKPDKKLSYVSLCEPIEKSLEIIHDSLKSHGIKVNLQYDCKKTLIPVHTNEMMQVFLNILKNAEDNFKEKNIDSPHIDITCTNTDQEAIVKICDNGGGIPESIIDKIFDPYFSTKDERHGTGLGLYMSKIIIEEHHGGHLHVTNQGKGSCFTIALPQKDA